MICDRKRHDIDTAIHKELVRSISKHGCWDDYSCFRMIVVIFGELLEVICALIRRDYHGKHGVWVEMAQVGACVQKFMYQVQRRFYS